jgi:glycosyltransferase involved in cell wall biosynthesis
MKVALDLSGLDPKFKQHAHRGIGRYVRELKKYFEEQSDLSEQVEFFDHNNIGGRYGSILTNACNYLPLCKQTIKQQLILPAFYRANSKQKIFHFPAHMDAPACGMPKYILTVLDLIPLVLPELYKAERANWRFKLARYLEIQSIKNAACLLCISECTANDVHRILGIDRSKIKVTPLGVDQKFYEFNTNMGREEFHQKFDLPIDQAKLLYVGGIDPRKNWSFALEVLAQIKKRFGAKCPSLIFAGNIATDREYPKLLNKISDLGLENEVKLLGFLSEDDLFAAYSYSEAFFFPSLYEGFGLPPLEAMATGLPVISSNTSCMPEVLGEAALFFDPANISEAVSAVEQILSDQTLRQDLSVKGKAQARKFTWDITGKKTELAYREILKLGH